MLLAPSIAMKLKRPIPKPDLWPDVPSRLAEKIHACFDRTVRIEVQAPIGRRKWETVNEIEVEAEDHAELGELSDAERIEALRNVGELVMACAQAHAMALGHSGKYRAAFVRKLGETDRRWATFPVDLEFEAERRLHKLRQRTGIRWSKSSNPWVNLVIANQALIELMVRFNDRVMDQLMEQRRIRQMQDEAMLRVILGELAVLCEEGLRMQADVARVVTEQRMQEQLAQARAKLDARVWETFAPVLEMAVARFVEIVEGARGAEGGAVEDAKEQEPERTEGAPPSSGDAPSEGKDGSGE